MHTQTKTHPSYHLGRLAQSCLEAAQHPTASRPRVRLCSVAQNQQFHSVSPSFSSIPHPVVDVCIAMLPWISPEGFIATIWHRLPVSTQKYPRPSSQQFQIMHLYNMLVHDHAEAQHTLFLFAHSCQLLFSIPNCETKHSHEGTVTTNFASFSSWSSL